MSSKPEKPDTSPWDRNRGIIRTSQGGWFAGKGVFNHGYDMMNDLVGCTSYMQVVVLNATGRLPDRKIADWLEALFICLSWPDPRIWCNHIGALAGTNSAEVVAGTLAGVLASDSNSYGIKPIKKGMQFIQEAVEAENNNIPLQEIISAYPHKQGVPQLMGYARPLAKGDERITAMKRVEQESGLTPGPHAQTAQRIDKYMQEKHKESININGHASAFLSDAGYTPEEAYRIGACIVASGVTSSFCEYRDKPGNQFLPLRCDDMEYTGKPYRPVKAS